MFVQAGWIVSASLIAPLPVTQAVAVRAPWLPCKFCFCKNNATTHRSRRRVALIACDEQQSENRKGTMRTNDHTFSL